MLKISKLLSCCCATPTIKINILARSPQKKIFQNILPLLPLQKWPNFIFVQK